MSAATDLAKEFEVLIGCNDTPASVSLWLDTGLPELNKAISGRYDGGFPVGRMVEMFGNESCGKTAIATMAMIAAQKAGGIAMFCDHEHSFEMEHAKQLGLDLTPGKFIYKTPETFEQSITMGIKVAEHVRANKLIAEDAPICVVFDSLAAMVPQSKFEKEAGEYNMNDNTALSRATSAAFPAFAQFTKKNNCLMLFLNQVRNKIGIVFGDKTTTPGGDSPKFYFSVRIKLGKKKIMKEIAGKKVFVGQEIHATCMKNKVNQPFQEADWNFMFRDGKGYFDAIGSTVDHLVKVGGLTKVGNFITWTDGKKYQRKKLVAKIEEDNLWDALTAQLPCD